MVSARDIDASELVKRTAEELKKVIEMPEWARFVKTGVSHERPPENKDWWYVRAASILRKVYTDGPVGVSRLRSYYGGLHRRGHKPAHFAKGGGKVVRTILQQLDKAGLTQNITKPRKGRIIAPPGQKMLDKIAKNIKV